MNNIIAYTTDTREIKRYVVPYYNAPKGIGVKEKPEPLTRKLMNKAITTLEEMKNTWRPNLSIYTEHL